MEEIRIAIRADASDKIGTGHVFRACALAIQLEKRGARMAFVMRDLPGHGREIVTRMVPKALQITLPKLLPSPDAGLYPAHEWLQTTEADDAATTLASLREAAFIPQMLIVDHYGIGAEWEQMARSEVPSIAVIDDLADRKHDCDFLIDQNFPVALQKYQKLLPDKCVQLLGPKYALLREEFAESAPPGEKKAPDSIPQIVIFFGGSDLQKTTLKTLRALRKCKIEFRADVIIGANNSDKPRIEQFCDLDPRISCSRGVRNMADRLAGADLFVGSGGTITWERLSAGLPGIIISVAKNQEPASEALGIAGLSHYLGAADHVKEFEIAEAVETLLANPSSLTRMRAEGRLLVDGRGAGRVADQLWPEKIRLRPAAPADSETILLWRNSEHVRRFSNNQEVIDLASHQEWFAAKLRDPEVSLLVGIVKEEPIGIIRFEHQARETGISIFLKPGKSSTGLGTELLKSGENWLLANRPEISEVVAQILPDNIASRRAFTKAGYAETNRGFVLNLQARKVPGADYGGR